ncbi:hypothetical protein BH10ACI2_BH10ACI2_11450 [soil metagenome]
MDKWLRDNLVCPRHKQALALEGDHLVCPENDKYLVIDGIPVMLFDDGNPTHGYISKTLEQVSRIEAGEAVKDVARFEGNIENGIDDFVKDELPYTCGNLYFAVRDTLNRYPFQEIRLPDGEGRRLIDIGCSWGRWTIPAEQKGYRTIGIDPNLDAVFAARRVARQVGVEPDFVVADALSLPFADNCVDVSFSYSVIQHLKKGNAKRALSEAARVTKPEGDILVQMPNKYGLRSLYHQVRMGFKDGREGGDVFYWSPRELKKEFEQQFGKTGLSVDCFFGLNLQRSDLDIMPPSHRFYIRTSEFFRTLSHSFSPLINVADSIYVTSVNEKASSTGKKGAA